MASSLNIPKDSEQHVAIITEAVKLYRQVYQSLVRSRGYSAKRAARTHASEAANDLLDSFGLPPLKDNKYFG